MSLLSASPALAYPTQAMIASLHNLQSLPARASMQANELSSKLMNISIMLRVQRPDIGEYVNMFM